jgi:Cation/multidrug efflux pump
MNLGRLSVNQPILAMVLSIVLLIVGAIAYRTLPVANIRKWCRRPWW